MIWIVVRCQLMAFAIQRKLALVDPVADATYGAAHIGGIRTSLAVAVEPAGKRFVAENHVFHFAIAIGNV